MWHGWFDFHDTHRSRGGGRRRPDRDLDRIAVVGIVVALALFLASHMPGPLVAPMVRDLLMLGALSTALVALLRGDPVGASEVTGWDQAAMLMLLGLIAGVFVEHEAVAGLLGAGAEAQPSGAQ